MTRAFTWIAVAAVATATMFTSSTARADGKNEIRAVTFEEDAGTTRIQVRGAETPTFTVYKLERPSRVVVDVPRARLADSLRGHEGATVITPSTWAVSTIAAQQIDDESQVVRVIVTLARPGRYDVKTEGNAVVVMVTARDPAPKTANPAELEQAKAEAERLRKVAAEQAARAELLQKQADAAKQSGQQANQAELARIRDEAARAKATAERARAEAEKAQRLAMSEVMKSRADADAAKQQAAREVDAAKQTAAREVMKSRADADLAKQVAAREAEAAIKSRADAEAVKQQAAREAEAAAKTRADAERAKQQAAREAEEAAKSLAAAERAKQQALREAEAAKQQAARDAEAAKQAAAREATAAKQQAAREAEAARIAAAREAEAARADLAKAKADAAAARLAAQKELDAATRAKADAERARREAEAAKSEATAVAVASRNEAEAAKAEAVKARAEAEAAKLAAAADRKQATQARSEADRTLREATAQLAALDKKTQAIQAMEDKARAANAAAQAREDQAREEVARAAKERAAAEAAAKAASDKAALAMKQSSSQSTTLAAEAKAAEERLAKARRATEEAEARRVAAETAATGAKQQLAETRGMLTAMEQQRRAAESAAQTAARQRSEAEAAASDATRRKSEAETAYAQAARLRKEAEQAAQAAAAQKSEAERERAFAEVQKKQAEQAARDAKLAAEAADKQRAIAEAAARTASEKQQVAETSLAALTAKRHEAEKAAALLEQRSKAEAKARAEIAAAEARKAGDAELAKARAEVARLAKERGLAETELADRRKAVAQQQTEASRLEAAAAQARDAATREESRRAQLAAQRATEEQELARIKAQKAAPAIKAPAPVVAEAPKPAPKGAMAKVTDIRFGGGDASAQVDIAMTPNAQVTVGAVTATTAELIIDNAELAQKLERKLDVTKFGSPVRAVSSFRDRKTPNRVRLVAELAHPVTPVFDRDANGGTWKFVSTRTAKATVQNVPPPVVAGFGATSTPITQQSVSQLPAQGSRGRRIYRGAVIDLDFKDAPLHDLLRLLGDTGRVNFVIPDNIDPRITVRLKRVPWDQALDVILQSHQLWYRRDGNLYRIAPRKELDQEDEAEAARREAATKSETPRSKIIPLNYADASELREKLTPMMSPRGRIEVDPRTNSLIVVDVAGNRDEIERLALSLDTQTPQISIEARIVEARSTFVRQFGIQWGGRATGSAAGGNATGLTFPSSIDLRGANVDGQTNDTGIVAPSDFAVNMPAATGSGEGGAIGLSLGSIGGNFAINLRLSALEDTGTIRIISAPKITVLNNKAATISQGVSIPISVISAAGTQTQFVQADLSLNVKPYVSQRDCAIAMDLTVTKNEPDFVNVGARGDPTILRKEAKTSMLVNDGETSVLGGIYTRNSGLAYKKVPFLADIPVLGWFFKNRRENDDRTEILVFITPKITNRQLLRCQ